MTRPAQPAPITAILAVRSAAIAVCCRAYAESVSEAILLLGKRWVRTLCAPRTCYMTADRVQIGHTYANVHSASCSRLPHRRNLDARIQQMGSQNHKRPSEGKVYLVTKLKTVRKAAVRSSGRTRAL